MKNRLNNMGFTLVELLAVLVILAAIMGIALPSITSSLERNKNKQNESKYKMLESFAEIYVTDNKNAIYENLNSGGVDKCYIEISDLDKYLSDGADKDADGNTIGGYVIFDRLNNNSYSYDFDNKDASGNELALLKCK